ncbi:bis-aminopropyl spermidine synthase family protein [Frankia sp. CcWB3]
MSPLHPLSGPDHPGRAPGDPAESGESLAILLAGYRVHARAPRAAVAALAEQPRTLRQLVQSSGLPRRSVEEILASLGDDLRTGPDGRHVLRPASIDRYRGLIRYDKLNGQTPLDPLAAVIARHGPLVTTMHDLIAAAPRPRADLDHVPATATTVVRRAGWLQTRYDLRGAHLLCIGDHDLTSLAAVSLIDGLTVTVVDIDDELLAYLDSSARSLGVRLRCLYADLRFGLPPAVVGTADLAFTDPPYTPEGVALFTGRGAQGLADREHGRVLLAYGFSDRVPTLGWKVQRALIDQGFVFEAIWPGFHVYEGAEAVGARADMYVCQPTPTTWKQLDRSATAATAATTATAAIYTRGRQSTQSRPTRLTAPVLDAVAAFLATGPAGRAVFVGERREVDAVHVRLATVFDRGLPAFASTGPGASTEDGTVSVATDLSDDPGPWLTRLLLAVNADRLAVVVSSDHPDLGVRRRRAQGDPLRQLRAKWTATPTRDLGDLRLVTFTAVDPAALGPADRLARWLLDRPHGKIGNVWRDGLIRIVREDSGRTLSQRDARAAVTRVARDPDLLAARLIDLPRHALEGILAALSSGDTLPAEPVRPGWIRQNGQTLRNE